MPFIEKHQRRTTAEFCVQPSPRPRGPHWWNRERQKLESTTATGHAAGHYLVCTAVRFLLAGKDKTLVL